MHRFFKNKKGFTLIELIVVIAILGILALIAIPRLAGFQETSRIRSDIANANTIASLVAVLHANGDIASGTYTLTGATPSGDLLDIQNGLRGEWPAVRATTQSANPVFEVAIDDNGVVTVITAKADGTNGIQIYPNPSSGIYQQ